MTNQTGKTPRARLQKLERASEQPSDEIRVYWGGPGEPEPDHQPGDLIIEWGVNDKITSRRVKAGDHDKNT